MADSSSITTAIDGVYNGVEGFVRGIGGMLGVDVDKPAHGEIMDPVPGISTPTLTVEPSMRPSQTLPPPTRVYALPAPVSAPAWFILPVRDVSGADHYVVTDGKTGVVTPSRQVAETLLATLQQGRAA